MRKGLILAVPIAAISLAAAFNARGAVASGMAQTIAPVGKHKTLELVFTAASAPVDPFGSCGSRMGCI